MQRALIALLCAACGSSGTSAPDAPPAAPDAGYVPGAPVTLAVGSLFPAGTMLRDAYGGAAAAVATDGTVTITPDPSGVVLLEKDGASASSFSWADVTVYNAIVDRYANGDPSNDGSYGRKKDGQMEVGTWHGGDWKGLTDKLDYIAGLGVTALWISPIVEQVHGWVSGGSGDFKYWGYHGYWALDFTLLDKNFGNQDDLQALIDGAHQRGIRVLVDVVMNHPGYATGADMRTYLPEVFNDGTGVAFTAYDASATSMFNKWNDLVNYNSDGWKNWWSPLWIRAGFPGFPQGGNDDLTRQLTFLPDFITEGTQPVDTPILFTRKTDTLFVAQDGFTVRQYLVKWHTDWVRALGVDGFRCDTAKNVELDSWAALKQAGVLALADWKAAHPALDDAPFWMTAEVFPHGVQRDGYYTQGGFDSVINFDFQRNLETILQAHAALAEAPDDLEAIYASQAQANAPPGFGILSYVSSHDTRLNFDFLGDDPGKQRQAGTALLLAPGGVEIFYGDESGRRGGPALSDSVQATRSDMNFATTDASILAHWQKLGQFRKKHTAVGAGAHQRLAAPAGTYAFARTFGPDAVVVVLVPPR
jgi:alpha-amylase